mgnify:CR=1 FL=1
MTKILFVDDDNDLLGITVFMLRDLNYEVISATNGEDAVKKKKKNLPDITIMDIKMPKMDGFDAFFRIKKVNPDAKIILISAYGIDEKKLLKAKSMGLLGMIKKPYEFETLEDLIKKYI